MLCAAAVAVMAGKAPAGSWIPQSGQISKFIYAAIALAAGTLIFLGLFTEYAIRAAGLFVIAIAIEQLAKTPFYNASTYLLPLLALTICIALYHPERNRLSLDRAFKRTSAVDREQINSWCVLFLRLFLGVIFVAQGFYSLFKVGLIPFAQRLYVTPFIDSGIPSALLWIAGLLNPPVQLIGGIALILGILTRFTSLGIGLFLLSIIFGHMVENPFDDLHDFSTANFVVVLAIIFLEPRGNRFSVDRLFLRRQPVNDELQQGAEPSPSGSTRL